MADNSKITNEIRHQINRASRVLIKDEALRKRLVEKYYSFRISRLNKNSDYARQTSEDLLDWRQTMSFRINCSKEIYRANCFYGIGWALRQYAEVDQPIKGCIEHGIYFGDYTNRAELDKSGLPCLVTSGPARLSHIRKSSHVPVVLIGPYIAYANEYLGNVEMRKMKKLLGKVLLVFPSHAVEQVEIDYKVDSFLEEVKRISVLESVDTTVVCLYYQDILNGDAERYEKAGCLVVTAGYREDSLFLSRLKTFIKISDITMSNSVGTHVGYCTFLNKPHYLFSQLISYKSSSVEGMEECKNSSSSELITEKDEVGAVYSKYMPVVSASQIEICEKYWGFSHVKSRDDLRILFELSNEAYSQPAACRQKTFMQIASGQVDVQ